jgi:hypothetical protein
MYENEPSYWVLGLPEPWQVEDLKLDFARRRMEVNKGTTRMESVCVGGTRFPLDVGLRCFAIQVPLTCGNVNDAGKWLRIDRREVNRIMSLHHTPHYQCFEQILQQPH